MLLSYFIDELLGTQGVKYISTEESGDELTVKVEMPRVEHVCPCCVTLTDQVHDYRYQDINAGTFNHKHVTVNYRKRRYRCPKCGKRFPEENSFVGRYQRITRAVIANIINFLTELVSFTHVARENRISTRTVIKTLDQIQYPSPKHLPAALGIDEFRGNANRVKYQVLLTDLTTRKPIDILPNRYESTITRYFMQYSREERDKVTTFVSDMFREYNRIGKEVFHNAVRVADPFHYVRLMIWALENIRKREQKRLGPARQKYFKKAKVLLIKRFGELSPDNQQAVLRMLELSSDLSTAHYYKERLLQIVDIEDVDEKIKLFHSLTDSMKNSGILELEKCADSYYNWFPNIVNSLRNIYSNGLTEGCNNKIKVLKRIAFGYRNYERFCKRIFHSFS